MPLLSTEEKEERPRRGSRPSEMSPGTNSCPPARSWTKGYAHSHCDPTEMKAPKKRQEDNQTKMCTSQSFCCDKLLLKFPVDIQLIPCDHEPTRTVQRKEKQCPQMGVTKLADCKYNAAKGKDECRGCARVQCKLFSFFHSFKFCQS